MAPGVLIEDPKEEAAVNVVPIVDDELISKGVHAETRVLEPGKADFPPLRTIWPHLKLEDHPVDETRRLRVAVVGAGLSGITAGILLPAKVPNIDLVIYERTDDIGGVWHTNVYPGVRCDVPAHAYQATFAPSTTWTEAFAQGHEIKDYWHRVAERYEVRKYVKLKHTVKRAQWSQEKGAWLLTVATPEGTFEDEVNFLLTATGHFSDPRLPSYPGMSDFKGLLRHSSNWDTTWDPAGKRIAVIGNGASGIQVLPQLQKVAAHIDHYARNKTWVASSIGGEDLAQFVADNIETARESPESYLAFRKDLESRLFGRFGPIFKEEETNNALRERITALMTKRLAGRKDLVEAIVPDFAPNCRRLTPGPGYLEALTQENVSYVTTPIERFTEKGIQTSDGIIREVDAVICSTGHDTTFTTQFPIVANGVDLQAAWRPGGNPGFPDSYLSMAAPEFPNLLLVLGPNTTGPAGTVPHALETQLTYMAKVLRKAASQGIKSMAPTAAATRDFRAYCESFFPKTVMIGDCSSWYNGGIKGGRIHGLWPGSGAHVARVRAEPRWEDWEYTYWNPQGNRFGWLGNGWTIRDVRAKDGIQGLDLDLTPWLRAEALEGKLDLRAYHEGWWENY
ncbi:flavin-binding monooxygenase [Thozetella sp. PMI_491]|nr:flavin-binding monooxygenase [Thozetella sp. PMI_491]